MARADLTAARLRELLEYDPETGVFRWRVSRGGSAKAGNIAGTSRNTSGRWFIVIDDATYALHRLAFLYMTGAHPKFVIDHIDGDPSNNRWANLRDVTLRVNSENRRKKHSNNTSGYLGVSLDKRRGTWGAFIKVGGKLKRLGSYKTPEEASAAYIRAKQDLHAGSTL